MKDNRHNQARSGRWNRPVSSLISDGSLNFKPKWSNATNESPGWESKWLSLSGKIKSLSSSLRVPRFVGLVSGDEADSLGSRQVNPSAQEFHED